MRPIILDRQFELAVPRERLWPVLGDTDRLNRAQGLPPVTYHVLPRAQGGIDIEGEARVGIIRLRWLEHPFEWIEGRKHWVVREYRRGPLREMRGGITLEDTEAGTRVQVRAELYPRGVLGWLVARVAAPRLGRDFEALCRAAARQIKAEQPVTLPGEAPADGDQIRARAIRVLARQALLAADDPLVLRLIEFLAAAPDREVTRIRPLALARAWNAPGMDVLRTCLRATRAGLLELTWDVICPGCRGAKERATTLTALKTEGHCDTCQIRFDVNFDQAVEVSFRAHPQVRKAEDIRFCAFGPSNTPHVLAQIMLDAGARTEETLTLPEGRYRLRSPEVPAATWVDAVEEGGAAAALFRLGAEGTATDSPLLARGVVTVTAENSTAAPGRLLLERADWAQDVATAAMVTTVQEFRDLFATEALSPETQLTIGSLTFLFTDLKGSTAMYTEMGDARAYALVRDHFGFLTDSVRRHEGAIVKTIGDAIMAVFQDPLHAVRCALDVQKRVPEFAPGVVIKMGLHTGACLAARLNDMLDYFGTTVNLSARVQHLSEGGDIVLTEAIARDVAVAALIEQEAPSIEEFTCELKGLDGRFRVCRLRLTKSRGSASEGA